MAKIDIAERKWREKVLGAREKWLAAVKSSSSLEEYVNKIADFTGLDPGTIRASFPARNYAEFQRNADQYVDAFINAVRRAAERGAWKKGYIDAFTRK